MGKEVYSYRHKSMQIKNTIRTLTRFITDISL